MEKLFLDASEVASTLCVSTQQAYKIIRQLNQKLEKQGYLVLRGKINRAYFMEQIYTRKEDC